MNNTNRNAVLRLSRYKIALIRLKKIGLSRVYSDNIADASGETASQVRKDFSQFGITGNKKGGYQVDDVISKLQGILAIDGGAPVVVVGVGKIGRALMEYEGFRLGSIRIAAGFDIDPQKIDENATVPVFPLNSLLPFVSEKNIKIGIIAVPYVAARQAFDLMIEAGIEGILNFAPIQFNSAENVFVSNVNFQVEIENLIYFVSERNP